MSKKEKLIENTEAAIDLIKDCVDEYIVEFNKDGNSDTIKLIIGMYTAHLKIQNTLLRNQLYIIKNVGPSVGPQAAEPRISGSELQAIKTNSKKLITCPRCEGVKTVPDGLARIVCPDCSGAGIAWVGPGEGTV